MAEQTANRPLPPPGQAPAGPRGLSASALKTIAILAMVVDHVAFAFVPYGTALYVAMRFVGRITGPVMFYFIAEGYHHTRNVGRYTLRLGLFALVSWPAFYYFEYGALPSPQSFTPFGVIYTLLLALLAIRARHEIQRPALRGLALLALVLLSGFGDWPMYGVALPLLFDLFRGSYKRQALAVGAVFLASIVLEPLLALVMGIPLGHEMLVYCIIQSGQFVPLALLALYNGQRGGGGILGKWFFYLIYPLHLLLLGLLKYVILAP